ncbi:MAG: FAD-binding domain-containing protein, partial [Bacteroidota bacterium]
NHIFKKGGTKEEVNYSLSDDRTTFNIWASGRTGIPLIDANMIELNRTGFMSNRGRQNVASFLVNDMKVNWQMGAEYFESLLIDYDPCSNYGNWNYIAGVGSDPRENRYFNIITQAKKYDPDGAYVKHWIPALQNVPGNKLYKLEQCSVQDQAEFGILLGSDYPKPVVSLYAGKA